MNGPLDNLKDDPRLTAFALGELEESERAAIAERVAIDPALLALVAEIQAEAAWLSQQLADEPAPSLDVARRAAILAAVPARPEAASKAGPRPPHRSRRGRILAALGALSSVAVAAVALFVVEQRSAAPTTVVASSAPAGVSIELDEGRFGKGSDRATSKPEEPARDVPRLALVPAIPEGASQPKAAGAGRGSVQTPDDGHRFRGASLNEAPKSTGEDGWAGHLGTELSRRGYKGNTGYYDDKDGQGDPGPLIPGSSGDLKPRFLQFQDGRWGPRPRGVAVSDPTSAEPVGGEQYREVQENTFVRTADQPETTFSIDVDTASYSNARRYLQGGQLPPPAAVRVEELVNYFPYQLPPPADGKPVAIHVDVTDAPWDATHLIARVALKAKELKGDRGRANLVFLIDVSGSMQTEQRLPLVKKSLRLLVKELRGDDTVALVVYAGSSGVVLPPTPARDSYKIIGALNRLESGGSTNGSGGIRLAYGVARGGFVQGGVNRVILATDGDFNVGITDRGELESLIKREAKSGVFLTVLGFGMGNLDDANLETLADRGNGNYAYVDRLAEAKKVLVNELGSTLVAVAKDVKVQLELNPAKVSAYRLIGYENRKLANRDFADDTKDAGEMGAGHAVTMLYELIPATSETVAEVRRYQRDLTEASQSGELFVVRVRYKQPNSDTSQLVERPVQESSGHFQGGSEDLRFATAVAAFGLLLKGSREIPSLSYEQVANWADGARSYDPSGWRKELVELALIAGRITSKERAVSSGGE